MLSLIQIIVIAWTDRQHSTVNISVVVFGCGSYWRNVVTWICKSSKIASCGIEGSRPGIIRLDFVKIGPRTAVC
jgi:hypothetical protein